MDRNLLRRWLAPTIQNKLLAVMLVVSLAPLVVFGTLAYFKARETIINQVGERLQAASLLAMSQVDRTFGFSQENIRSWAALDVLQEVERGDPQGVVSEMLRDYQQAYAVFNTLVAVDMEGIVVAAGDKDLLGINVTQAEWFGLVKSTGRPQMSALRFDPQLGGYGVSISVPIFRSFSNGQVVGVLKASFDWQELLNQIQAIEVMQGGQNELGYSVLIDRDGYVIAAPDFILADDDGSQDAEDQLRVYGKRWWAAENPLLLDRLLSRSGHRHIRRGATELLLVNMPAREFRNIRDTGWSLVLVRDADHALADIAFIRERAVLIGVLAILLIAVVAYVMSRQIGEPISRLSSWARELSRGNLDRKLSLRSNDELGQLAVSLDNMRQDIKSYLDEITESKERYQAIMSSIDCVVWEAQINPPRVTLLSGQVEHVLGHSPDKVLQMLQQWRQWIHPDHHARILAAFHDSVSGARDSYVEFKVRHGDGQWMWLKALISVVIDGLKVTGLRGVIVDIDDIVEASEEMAEARDIALKTAESKSRFMAIVSHEIRTPMNGMLGMLDMLNDSTLSEEQHETLRLATRAGRNLLSLVDDVMDFSRLESGEMEFRHEQVNVHELLHSAINLVAPDAYKAGLDIGIVLEANLPLKIVTDATKLRQLLTSLLSNAVKFTSHGSILLWAEMLPPHRLYVEVKDTGMGIDADVQQDIFQPFVQADASSTRKFGGSGLGLALCEGIASAMGGRIGVKSIKGVGSSFFFELPVEVPHGQTPLATRMREAFQQYQQGQRIQNGAVLLIGDLPATQMVIQIACQQWGLDFHWEPKETRVMRNLEEIIAGRNYRWIFIAQEISDRFWEKLSIHLKNASHSRIIQLRLPTERYGQRPLPHLYVPFSTAQLAECMTGYVRGEALDMTPHLQVSNLSTVLVVDDNEVNRRVACGYLRKMGFTCDIAENGQQALDAVQANAYLMIFMDCQMPLMDGYEATRRIRAWLDGRPLPIIAVTANAMEGDREKCLAAGMDDYLAKPLRLETLEKTVERWLPVAQRARH